MTSEIAVKTEFKTLSILTKTEDMIVYLYTVLEQYPKSEKLALTAETKMAATKLLKLVISCNKHYYKQTSMREVDTQLDFLRVFARLGNRLGFLQNHAYEVLSAKLDEIGRMIGGWFKSLQK